MMDDMTFIVQYYLKQRVLTLADHFGLVYITGWYVGVLQRSAYSAAGSR